MAFARDFSRAAQWTLTHTLSASNNVGRLRKPSVAKKAQCRATKREEVRIAPDLTHYRKVKKASGRKSLDIGDKVARMLRGLTLEQVYEVAGKNLGHALTVERKERDKALNLGMQRMNIGSRLRKVLRRK